jgi:hypothetical protein
VIAYFGCSTELLEDRIEASLGILGREVLVGGAGAVARAPDDRAARSSATRVADVRGTKPLPAAYAVLVAPERKIRTRAVAVEARRGAS